MSIELEVFLNRSDLPTSDAWIQAIKNQRVPVKMSEDFELETHSGYLPVKLKDENTGFELDITQINFDNLSSEYPAEVSQKDTVASFQFSQETEVIAALISAASLAQISNGIIFDQSEDAIVSCEEALSEAQSAWAIYQDNKRKSNRKGRTPAKWRKELLQICKSIHPDYENNKRFKGNRIEYIRKLESGLYASHSCIHNRGTYYHCFAILLTTSDVIYCPMYAGGRFNEYFDIFHAFEDDLSLERGNPNRPQGIMGSHEFRSTSAKHMKQSCQNAENYLLPYYLKEITESSDALVALYSTAHDLLSELRVNELDINTNSMPESISSLFATEFRFSPEKGFSDWDEEYRKSCAVYARAADLGIDVKRALTLRIPCCNLSVRDVMSPKKELSALSEIERNQIIVLNKWESFLAVQDELLSMARVCEQLK